MDKIDSGNNIQSLFLRQSLKTINFNFTELQIDNLGATDPKITLVEEQGKRHSQVEILDTRMGVLARPSARIFQPLYDDQLAVHIGADTGKNINLFLKFELCPF